MSHRYPTAQELVDGTWPSSPASPDDRDWQTVRTPMGWTLAQDGAQSSLELTEPVMEHFTGMLDDEDATDDALYKASVLHLLTSIAHGLIDVAAAIREGQKR